MDWIQYNKWMSETLNIKAGDMVSNYQPSHLELTKFFDDGYDFINTKVDSCNIKLIQYLETLGFRLNGITVTFTKKLSKDFDDIQSTNIREASIEDMPEIIEITNDCYFRDRFHRDFFISKEQADKLYERWITNLFESNNSKIFVYKNYNEVIAYTAIQMQCYDLGSIVLTAKKFTAGLDTKESIIQDLLKTAINYLYNNKITTVETSTQISNVPSIRSLELLDFKQNSKVNVSMSLGRQIMYDRE